MELDTVANNLLTPLVNTRAAAAFGLILSRLHGHTIDGKTYPSSTWRNVALLVNIVSMIRPSRSRDHCYDIEGTTVHIWALTNPYEYIGKLNNLAARPIESMLAPLASFLLCSAEVSTCRTQQRV
jgi:hypothetical protein